MARDSRSLQIFIKVLLQTCLAMACCPIIEHSLSEALALPSYALPTLSGYFLITPTSKMHYTYYEAFSIDDRVSQMDTPILLWLQGGPGCAGGIGNFYEIGRWRITPDLRIEENFGAWNRKFGILFVDNPVGTGFSPAATDDLPTNQSTIAAHLYKALVQFFDENPSFRVRPFFVTGESYGGKYVPSLCYHILTMFEEMDARERSLKGSIDAMATHPFNLNGLVIGNGLTDPPVMITGSGDAAYQAGLIDFKQKAVVDEIANRAVLNVQQGDWEAAADDRVQLTEYIQNVSGIATTLDVRRDVPYNHNSDNVEFLHLFLNAPLVKSALNVDPNVTWESCNERPLQALKQDMMKSVKWKVEYLLRKLPVLLFQGVFDIRDGVTSTEKWVRTMKWEHIDAFFESPRMIWRVDGQLAGYWRSFGGLTNVVVRGAGHEVSADQCIFTQNMIETWIQEQLPSKLSRRRTEQ